MTFCQLTWHPVVIGEWKYHHSNWPIEMSQMVVFPFFYNHWMPRYSNGTGTKMPIYDISSNILVSSGRRRIRIPPFNLPRRAGSNGGIPFFYGCWMLRYL